MNALPQSVQQVIDEFGKLPGVGPKSASRMAYYYLRDKNERALDLAKALLEMQKKIVLCKHCFNVSESEICEICDRSDEDNVQAKKLKKSIYSQKSSSRDSTKLCVVEESLDIVAIETAGVYDGLYFVLGGVISPADGISEHELRFDKLTERVKQLLGKFSTDSTIEIIVAVNPSVEGEATYEYMVRLFDKEISNSRVNLTKLAIGLPTGADLEYADKFTLSNAFESRK